MAKWVDADQGGCGWSTDPQAPGTGRAFRVVRDQLQVYRKNEWFTLNPVDEIHIPKETAHTYRSSYREDSIFEYRLTP